MPGKFGGDTDSLERALDGLTESLDRLSSNVENGNRQSTLGGSGGRTTSGGVGRRGTSNGGFSGAFNTAAGFVGGIAATKTLGFAKAATNAGVASFALSRGSIGFEGAVTNGTAAALRLIPGGSAIVDRAQGPATRAIGRARGVIEPILRGGGLRNKKDLANVSNKLFARFKRQEDRAQKGIDFFQKKQQDENSKAGEKIAEDLKKLGKQMAEAFIETIKKGSAGDAARGFFGAAGFAIPKYGGGK